MQEFHDEESLGDLEENKPEKGTDKKLLNNEEIEVEL